MGFTAVSLELGFGSGTTLDEDFSELLLDLDDFTELLDSDFFSDELDFGSTLEEDFSELLLDLDVFTELLEETFLPESGLEEDELTSSSLPPNSAD